MRKVDVRGRGSSSRSVALTLLAVLAILSFPVATPAVDGLTQVPILWCVLKGTDLENASAGDRNRELWRLHELPSDFVYIPQARVTLRSELVWNLREAANFKVIDDPDTSGTLGDVATADELQKAQDNCRKAYEGDANINQVALQGITGIYLRRLLYVRGGDTSSNSFYGVGVGGTPTGNFCSNPPTVTKWVNGYFGVEETVRNSTSGSDPNQFGAVTFLAHEFGHSVSLRHGDGKDNTGEGVVDEDSFGGCGNAEAGTAQVCRTPATIMSASAAECSGTFNADQKKTTFITPEQIAQLQKVGKAVPGQQDPPGPPIPGPVLSDYRSDPRDDVNLRRIDLTAQIVAHDSDSANTTFIHRLNGLTDRERVGLSYVVFVDLDGDPSTGGSPSSLGFDTAFTGAELVAQVIFVNTGPSEFPEINPVPRVWRFQGGAFVSITPNPGITASVHTAVEGETGIAAFDNVTITIPDAVIGVSGPLHVPLRLQAIAQNPAVVAVGGDVPSTLDRLPDDPAGGVNFWLVEARYPNCDVSPNPVFQGRHVTVSADFPLAHAPVHVVLGADQVAEGTTNDSGIANIPFRIPRDAQIGERLVTVGMGTTALTGDCTVTVLQAPPNSPPDCSAAFASPERLWSPDHKFVDVSVQGVVDVDEDPVTITITDIRQDEPLRDGGSGNTCPDGDGLGGPAARVRAERAGNPQLPGDGRVYHIGFTASDGLAECSGSVTACVPHDPRASTCVDGGALFSSTGPCTIAVGMSSVK